MKCPVCAQRKGKRSCVKLSNVICSECCGNIRHITTCPSDCTYLHQKFERISTESMELTEVGRGKVIRFSDSLFLPDILECFYVDLNNVSICIIEPTRILFSTKFTIRKMVERNATLSEAYVADSWKKSQDALKGIPFLQIYAIGFGKINNISLKNGNMLLNCEAENNHIDTWLPMSYSGIRRLSKKEIVEYYGTEEAPNQALCYYGKHFWGNNSTLFALLDSEKEYSLNLEVIYEKPYYEGTEVIMPFGLFWPFKLVNYNKFVINNSSNLSIDSASNTMLLLPFENEEVMCNAIPLLEENSSLSSAKYISYKASEMEVEFHYDEYCILYTHFKVKLEDAVVAKAIFNKLPILSGVYDSVNKLYNDEYAPAMVVICNNSTKIEKYVIKAEIMGVSYILVKEVFVEPYKVEQIKVAPKLMENKVLALESNSPFDMYVSVYTSGNKIIYEETEQCILYPREVFVNILKNKTKDWKLDLHSFIARWITPTASLVNEIVASAGRALPNGMNGANSDYNDSIQAEIKSIYDYLGGKMKIKYVNRPLAFSEGDYHAQNVSLPSSTIKYKSGNCIDLSILLASCLEALKLHTYIVLIPNHAFLKVLLPRDEELFIESTFLGKHEYFEAVESAREKYNQYFGKDGPKEEGAREIDIEIARKSGIFPME